MFYGALEQRTACAEIGYWRWRFVQDSEGLDQLEAKPMSLFAADIRTRSAINLRKPPLSRKRKAWTDPDSYIETQALARNAREQSIDAIVYE